MSYKRTTYSGKNGTRTTYTQSRKGPNRSSKITQSHGSGNTRITKTTNLNTGESKTYMTQRTADGWVSRKSLSAPKSKPVKFKKPKKIRYKKSKPIKFSTLFWILCTIYVISVITK